MFDLEVLMHKLEEASETEDWSLVQEVIDEIVIEIDNPFQEYNEEGEEENW
jgi:hypothetical protein|tara:strand:- start:646 stop:798 length:153 start_codon:yes stop_codon:yes gene_type:complete